MADKISWTIDFVRSVFRLVFLFCLAAAVHAQRMTPSKATIQYLHSDFVIRDLDNRSWKSADAVHVSTYWNGENALAGRGFEARMLWSDTGLYVRFVADQSEPLVVSKTPNLSKKTMQLWDRDVCEIFIAPDPKQPRKYFKFEIAPTGEWIDLAIDLSGAERKTDWDYRSGMTSASRIDKDKVVMAIKIPWSALSSTPKAGDVWRGNLYRCVGTDPMRGYLAWRPTMTERPNFHVPEKFGEFVFVK